MNSLTISKLASACGVKTDTIRHYERKKILLPDHRSPAGYRLYSNDSIKRLRFIKKAQTLGFTLQEIKALLELSEKPESDCSDVRRTAQTKINEIENKISDLNSMQKALENLASFCPGEGKPLSECNILIHFYGDSE